MGSPKSTSINFKNQQSHSVKETFYRAFKRSNFEDKDEFLDIIYWLRQFIGIIIGAVFGIVPLKGIFSLILFAALNTGFVYFYSISFQGINEKEEEYDVWEIVKEGFMTAFAGFVVTWIIFYTGIHYEEKS